MPNPFPLDLRVRAVAAYEAGAGTYSDVAGMFALSSSALQRWVRRKRETGAVDALPKGGGWRSPVRREVLEAVVDEQPDRTSDEITRAYNRRVPRAARVHRSSILRALARASFRYKKNARARRSTTGRMSRWRADDSGVGVASFQGGGSSSSTNRA